MRWLSILLVLAGVARGGELTPAAREFLRLLHQSGEPGGANAGPLGIGARGGPICSQGMMDAVRAADALTDEQRAALRSLVRLDVREAGWLEHMPVEPGRYTVGIEPAGDDFAFVFYDADGARVGDQPMWIDVPTDAAPSCSAMSSGGRATVSLRAGGITFSWTLVPRKAHDELLAGLRETRVGPVALWSDLGVRDVERALADDAARAVAVHARILGKPVPPGPLRIHLFRDAKRYRAVAQLTGSAAFAERFGFTSHATGYAYVRAGGLAPADALPLDVRITIAHELFHLVAECAYPGAFRRWPTWLSEGLAQAAAERVLDDPAMREQELGYWTHARLRGTAPRVADLMAGSVGPDVPSYYAAAYLFVAPLLERPAELHALLAATTAAPVRRASYVARAELESRFQPAATRFREILELPESRHPAVPFGHLDTIGGRRRLVSPDAAQGRVVYPAHVEGPAVEVETTFSWGKEGQKQIDVYVAYSEGARAEEFLKLALLPKAAVLFRFRDGAWVTLGRVDYETALVEGEEHRHPLKLSYDARSGKLRVETAGGRWAEFACRDRVSVAGTRVAIGCFASVVYFDDPKVTSR